MLLRNKVSFLLIGLSLIFPLAGNAETKVEQDTNFSAADLEQELLGFYPPSITELFDNANDVNLLQGWEEKIELNTDNYASEEAPRKAFMVGDTLAEIAFLILTQESPSYDSLTMKAFYALQAINPPTEIQAELERLSKGNLKDEELRKAIQQFINETVPLITESEQQGLKDTGMLVMAAGYFKALYMGASELASQTSPKSNALEIMLGWKDITSHTIDYFENHASDEFQDSVIVIDLLATLKTIDPLLNKSLDNLTKQDAEQVANALSEVFTP